MNDEEISDAQKEHIQFNDMVKRKRRNRRLV
jgi:hypothetical protein